MSGQSWSSERCSALSMCRTLTLLTQSQLALCRVLSGTKKSTLAMETFFQCALEWKIEDNTVRSNGSGSSAQIPSHLMPCADSDIIHVSALGTLMITCIFKLNSYKVASDLLDPVLTPAGKYASTLFLGKSILAWIWLRLYLQYTSPLDVSRGCSQTLLIPVSEINRAK